MQTIPDEWPSMTRMLSCRHSNKVSCETLTLSHVDLPSSNPQFEAHSFYYSDDEKDHRKEDSTSTGDDEASELENPSYGYGNLSNHFLQQARELEKHSGKLDNPSHGDGKTAGHKLLACFHSKTSHIPAARRAKEVERLRKHLRAYPSAIHGTGGVLPHSGPILLHIGSHSGPLNSKAPATLRASSIIPRNAVAGKMNPSGVGDPSSPKVTCLGRVRNKKKHIGNCTSVVTDGTKGNQLDVCCMSILKRREMKKADTEVVESLSKKEKKASRMGSGNAMAADHRVEQSKETDCEKALKKLTAQISGGKGSVSSRYVAKEESTRWSSRETTNHEESKISYQHQQKGQAKEASALGDSSPEAEFSIDLSRFGSEESQIGHETMVANSATSSVGSDSQRFEQDDKEDSVQAPPRNALLKIRNRKVKDNPEVASSSALSNGQETRIPTALGTQISISTSTLHKYDQFLPHVTEGEMKKPPTIADILGHISSPMIFKMEGASARACKSERFQRKFSLQTEHTGVHRQASLPKPFPEVSLWQRRAIEKPCALDVKKPLKSEINRRTTISVNKN